jgi:hypothetical protein
MSDSLHTCFLSKVVLTFPNPVKLTYVTSLDLLHYPSYFQHIDLSTLHMIITSNGTDGNRKRLSS